MLTYDAGKLKKDLQVVLIIWGKETESLFSLSFLSSSLYFYLFFLFFFVVCGGGGWSNVPSAPPPPLNLPVLMNYLWEQKLSFINLISLFGFLWVNKYKLRTLQTLYIREIRYGIEMYLIPGLICVVDRYSYDGLRLGVH